MASYDLSAILNALQGYQSQSRPRRQPNNRSVKQYLLNKGVPERIAWLTSMNEFCYWTEKELDETFDALDLPAGVPLNQLISFTPQTGSQGSTAEFVKPTQEDIQRSVDCLGALCVDRNGSFCINPTDGFAALSHVWSQGLGADDDNRGLHKSLLDQVFDKVESLGIRWIWTDSLAIPGGKRALNLLEEELKGALINAMADIYRQAQYVVIFDALCLRLNSTEPVKVAAVTSLGTWMTRMWTYQEIKLATNAIVATKTGFVPFSSLTQTLKSHALQEVGEDYTADTPGKYPSLAKTFLRLQRNDELGISLPDAAIGCGYREAWDRLDYARALFPTFNIEWRTNYDVGQAMEKLYTSQKYNAMRLALFHGPPRASIPGWAPAVFNGLVDCKIIEAGTWKHRGMQRSWHTTKVKAIVPSKTGTLVLALESDFADRALSVGFVSEETQKQSPHSVELFRKAVAEGEAYLLADEPLVPKRHFSRVALLVQQFSKVDELEAWVCLTLAVGETEEHYKREKRDWLLLHENPVSEEDLSGKKSSELFYIMTQSIRPGMTVDLEQFPLHQAAMEGNLEECRMLLTVIDVNTVDSRGWTALHVAAAADQRTIIPLFAEAGANMDAFDPNGQSALVLAIENNHIDAVIDLCEAGADVNVAHRNGFSPLCTAVHRGVEMINLLLALGADPSAKDAGGWVPLYFAIWEEPNTDVLEALLEAGANPNVPSQDLVYPIEGAARKGNAFATRLLLDHSADPNMTMRDFDPALYHAIASGSLETVRALVDGGASCTVRFKDGWTPMLLAAKKGDHEMGRVLKAKGADLNDTTAEGLTPLHIAGMNGSRVFFKWLLEEGVDRNARDAQGRTAFDVIKGFELAI